MICSWKITRVFLCPFFAYAMFINETPVHFIHLHTSYLRTFTWEVFIKFYQKVFFFFFIKTSPQFQQNFLVFSGFMAPVKEPVCMFTTIMLNKFWHKKKKNPLLSWIQPNLYQQWHLSVQGMYCLCTWAKADIGTRIHKAMTSFTSLAVWLKDRSAFPKQPHNVP